MHKMTSLKDICKNMCPPTYVVGGNKWIPTSVIPIGPKLSNFEMWNDIIISLALDNWKLTNE